MAEKYIETEVSFEDGRKGKISATVKIEDMTVHPYQADSVREAAE